MSLSDASVKEVCDAHNWAPRHSLPIGSACVAWLPNLRLEPHIADIIAHCAAQMEAGLLGAKVDNPRDLERIVNLTLLKVCLNGLLAARNMKHGAEPIDIADAVTDADNGTADTGAAEVHDIGAADEKPEPEPGKDDDNVSDAG